MSGPERELIGMREAVGLAEGVLGTTSPNPPVGCVILSAEGEVVGRGTTTPAGGPHAEVVALRAAGQQARGGTAIVTLEPCSRFGRTPPCTQALIQAGVKRVVYAVRDPLQPGGDEALQQAGIEVYSTLLTDLVVRGPLRYWLTYANTGRPYITAKLAMTLDGKAAASDGTSQWITGAEARLDSHRYRRMADAVVVGSGTVLADDPQLTARLTDGSAAERQPLRVVLDRRGRLPQAAKVLDDAAPTMVLSSPDLLSTLGDLVKLDVVHAFVEGGPTLVSEFIRQGLVDQLVIYLAPALLGSGVPVIEFAGLPTVTDALRLKFDPVCKVGNDLLLIATFPPARGRAAPAHHHASEESP
jgi:diaminohydroxyphosphoribosylaminopyrimidine deaminase / 5-amino-6-(5-phosphoribosylamino)uracil reductase